MNQKNNKRYRLHYALRMKGHTVDTKNRTVTKRSSHLTKIEDKWIKELVSFGYAVGDWMFQNV